MVCHARATARRLDMPGFAALDLLGAVRVCAPGAVLRADAARIGCRARTASAGEHGRSLRRARNRGARPIAGAGAGDRPQRPRHRRDRRARRLGLGAGGARRVAARRPGGAAPRGGLARLAGARRMAGARAAAAARQPAGQRRRGARAARRTARRRRREAAASRPITPPRSPTPSCRASTPTSRRRCSPRPAPGSARRSAISRRRACGPRRTRARCGSRPIPATCRAQIAGELDRLYPEPVQKRRRVVVRKGRENFLCLLNYEDAVRATMARAQPSAPLALIARWIGATEAGDLVAGDFPGWLAELIGALPRQGARRPARRMHPFGLPAFPQMLCREERACRAPRPARRRQPCAGHGAGGARRARRRHGADPLRVRRGASPARSRRLRVFGAAVGAARAASCAAGSSAPKPTRSRARGLQRRIGDLIEADEERPQALIEALVAARILPADGWHQRVAEGAALPGFESFLALVRQQVLARAAGIDSGYGLEAEARPPVDGPGRRRRCGSPQGLDRLPTAMRPPLGLAAQAARRPGEPARSRPPASGSTRRSAASSAAPTCCSASWSALLRDLGEPARPETVEWLALDRFDGNETDIALNRNWVDPGIPFVRARRAAGARHRRDLGDA